jgi:hypothetical protein
MPYLTHLALLLSLLPPITEGHGYLKTPRSRNLYAYLERDWEDGGGTSPYPEDCTFRAFVSYLITYNIITFTSIHLIHPLRLLLTNTHIRSTLSQPRRKQSPMRPPRGHRSKSKPLDTKLRRPPHLSRRTLTTHHSRNLRRRRHYRSGSYGNDSS